MASTYFGFGGGSGASFSSMPEGATCCFCCCLASLRALPFRRPDEGAALLLAAAPAVGGAASEVVYPCFLAVVASHEATMSVSRLYCWYIERKLVDGILKSYPIPKCNGF